MTEKILTNKKHGMAMLIFFLLLMAAAIVMVVIGAMRNIIALILPGIVILCFIWIPMMGLKILKPQEALVLTLFGHYYGTLKGEGYYYLYRRQSCCQDTAEPERRCQNTGCKGHHRR